MRTRTIILAATAALGVGLAGAAVSAKGAAGGKMFQKLDADGNGTVNLEEARAGQNRWFARLDANGDGTISREEFQATADKRFARYDLDGNGEVTADEMAQARKMHKNKSTN